MIAFRTASLLLATTLVAGCLDTTTAPLPDPVVYDLIFESTASPAETQSQLFVLRQGATSAVPLFAAGTYASQPHVSADGRWVAFVSLRPEDGASAVWIARTDGTQGHLVFTTDETLLWPAPSPDGSQIAFQVFDDVTGSSRIWIVNANGSGARAITLDAQPDPFVRTAPSWSPDGTTIAFAMGAPGSLRIATIPAAGGAVTTVTQPVAGNATEPSWSPSGNFLVFARTTSPALSDLVIVNRATGGLTALYTGNAHSPAWSPSGQIILFSARSGGEPSEIYAIDAVGGTPQRITNNQVMDRFPNWARRTP